MWLVEKLGHLFDDLLAGASRGLPERLLKLPKQDFAVRGRDGGRYSLIVNSAQVY